MNEVIAGAGQDAISWAAIVRALLILLVGWIVARLASRFFRRMMVFKLTAHQLSLYDRLVFYTLFTLFSVTAIHQLGFKISVLLGAAGILTVALGFAAQTSASNLISGLFLLGEKPFEVGDVIQVEGDSGEVISIDMLSVKLRTPDNLFVRMPNELLIKSKLVNLTKFPIRRIDLTIGVAYREDLQRVIRLLLDLVNSEPRCLEEPQPFCRVTTFNTSSVDLQLSAWTQREIFSEVKASLLVAVKALFDREGIEMPFPHVSLYSSSETAPIPIRLTRDSGAQNQERS